MSALVRTTYKECLKQSRHYDKNPALKLSLSGRKSPLIKRLFYGSKYYFSPFSFESYTKKLFRQPLSPNENINERLGAAFSAIKYLAENRAQFRKLYPDYESWSKTIDSTTNTGPPLATPVKSLTPGCLLLAHPHNNDKYNWKHAVVLITEYSSRGVSGLILNKPEIENASQYKGLDPNENWGELFDAVGRKPMWHGGPVEMSKLSILHKGKAVNGATELGHQLYVNADKHDIANLIKSGELKPEDIRIFSGRAEWFPGQLQEELRLGCWLLVQPLQDVVFMNNVEQNIIENQHDTPEDTIKATENQEEEEEDEDEEEADEGDDDEDALAELEQIENEIAKQGIYEGQKPSTTSLKNFIINLENFLKYGYPSPSKLIDKYPAFDLWSSILKSMEGEYRYFSNVPVDFDRWFQ